MPSRLYKNQDPIGLRSTIGVTQVDLDHGHHTYGRESQVARLQAVRLRLAEPINSPIGALLQPFIASFVTAFLSAPFECGAKYGFLHFSNSIDGQRFQNKKASRHLVVDQLLLDPQP